MDRLAMTKAHTQLLSAAKEALEWFDRREHGMPQRGMYEDILTARRLQEAVTAVDAELAADSRMSLEELEARR